MDYLNYFLPTVEHLGMFGYWLVLLISLLESLAFVGIIVPGSVLVITAGFLSAHGYFGIGDLIWFATIGAILGDGISYYLGTKGTKFFRNENKILKLNHLDRGKHFFKKYGNKSVFLSRFIGPVRSLIPFIAGLFKMNKASFFFWNVSGAFLWATAYLLVGYFFGGVVKAIEAWSTRAVVFILFLFLVLLLIWLMIKKIGHFFDFSKSIIFSIKETIVLNPDVIQIVKNHPIFFDFIRQRMTMKKFSGLSLTLLFIAFAYITSILFGVAKNVVTSGPIIATDVRVENLLYAFRDFELVKVFTWITVLAKWEVVLIFTLTASVVLWLRSKKFYIIPLWVTIIGSGLSNLIGKIAFHRARPEVALYTESTYSFPSGHSTIAMAFFGFVIYILLRRARKWEYKINILFIGLVIILSVGLSRLYLGLHFLSDIWGGYLLGLLWLVVGIAIAEWLNSRIKTSPSSISRKAKLLSSVLILFAIVVYVNFALKYNPITNKKIESIDLTTPSVTNFLSINNLPRFTETLIGDNQEPLSFIIIAENDQYLIDNMLTAGWHLVDKINISSVARIAKSTIFKEDYTKAPITPSFWNSKVNDFGFEKPTEANNVRERHHVRFWRTQFKAENGSRIYVGTASLDIGIKWLIMNKIRSDIDTERDVLFADLNDKGLVLSYEKMQSVEPTLGKNFSDDQFSTDGKLYLIFLK